MLSKALKAVGDFVAPIAPIAPIIGAGLSYLGGRGQNVASAQAAQRQMDFQRELSDTSYQRQIADLKAAGINPMLVSKLGGASTPAGAMPQFVNPGFQAGQIFSGLQSSAASAQQAETAERLSESQVKQIDATVEKIKEETKNVPLEGQRLIKTAQMLTSQSYLMLQQGDTQSEIRDQLIAIVSKLKQETKLLEFDVKAAQLLDNFGREAGQLNPAARIVIEVLKGIGRGK